MTNPDDDADVRPHMTKALDALQALIDHGPPSEYELKLFYETLDLIPWLASKVRYAVNEELDSSTEVVIEHSPEGVRIIGRRRHSTRAKNEERQQVQALAHYYAIEARKAQMKASGERPRGVAGLVVYCRNGNGHQQMPLGRL
jgi:hypothetical protein